MDSVHSAGSIQAKLNPTMAAALTSNKPVKRNRRKSSRPAQCIQAVPTSQPSTQVMPVITSVLSQSESDWEAIRDHGEISEVTSQNSDSVGQMSGGDSGFGDHQVEAGDRAGVYESADGDMLVLKSEDLEGRLIGKLFNRSSTSKDVMMLRGIHI